MSTNVWTETPATKGTAGYWYLNPGTNHYQTCYQNDPRLKDVRRMIMTILDRPPLSECLMPGDAINSPDNDKYRTGYYPSYEDVNIGQMTYYVDNELNQPFYAPNFTTPTMLRTKLYTDPMDASYPDFRRMERVDQCGSNSVGCLTSMNDTNEFREDIISRQMNKQSGQRFYLS